MTAEHGYIHASNQLMCKFLNLTKQYSTRSRGSRFRYFFFFKGGSSPAGLRSTFSSFVLCSFWSLTTNLGRFGWAVRTDRANQHPHFISTHIKMKVYIYIAFSRNITLIIKSWTFQVLIFLLDCLHCFELLATNCPVTVHKP